MGPVHRAGLPGEVPVTRRGKKASIGPVDCEELLRARDRTHRSQTLLMQQSQQQERHTYRLVITGLTVAVAGLAGVRLLGMA